MLRDLDGERDWERERDRERERDLDFDGERERERDLDLEPERDRDFLLDAREDALDEARDSPSFSASEPLPSFFSTSC